MEGGVRTPGEAQCEAWGHGFCLSGYTATLFLFCFQGFVQKVLDQDLWGFGVKEADGVEAVRAVRGRRGDVPTGSALFWFLAFSSKLLLLLACYVDARAFSFFYFIYFSPIGS
jgi:hypothetical protein